MEIKIEKKVDDDLIKEAIVKWNFAAKKNFIAIGFCFLISIIFFSIGLLFSVGNSFWGFATCMGFCFAILSIIFADLLYRSRLKLIEKTKDFIKNRNDKSPIKYVFTDEMVTISGFESYAEINWSAFTSYKLHKNYLFLFLRSYETSSITINQVDLSENDYSTLFLFISNRFREKN